MQEAINLQKNLEKKLYQFVDVLDLAICNRCFYFRYKSKKWTNHHQSKLSIEFSKNRNIKEKHIDDWALETEHGLLHSFLVAFFAYQEILKKYKHNEILNIIRKGKFEENWFEKLIASCLLHDIVRFTEDPSDHDKRLKDFFPDLSKDVYTHSNPKEETPLVIGDRIELRRFNNWEQWVNVNIKKYTKELEINYFYKYIRPVLTELFEGRYDLWIRHGTEAKTDFTKNHFPQGFDPVIKRQKLDLCSIETGKLFTFSTQEYPNSNCILDHSQKWSPRGLLRLKKLKKLKYKCIPCRTYSGRDHKLENGLIKGRDHLCLEKFKIPKDEWIFFYHYDFIGQYCSLENVVNNTKGIEEKLAIRILNCTEKLVERMKFLID